MILKPLILFITFAALLAVVAISMAPKITPLSPLCECVCPLGLAEQAAAKNAAHAEARGAKLPTTTMDGNLQ